MGVKLGISRDSEWGEYRVYWIDDVEGYDESKTSYHDEAQDAVDTLLFNLGRYPEARLSKSQLTRNLIKRYHSEFFNTWEERE